MKAAKRKRLERAGWRFGSAAEFLELTEEEQTLVEITLALADGVNEQREKDRLSQGLSYTNEFEPVARGEE